jgi:DNA-binding NarL/FixJ family response regulator
VVAAPLRVLLVEDNDTFREALELLFGLRPDVEVVGSLAEGAGAAEACLELNPHVVVLDYRLRDADSIDVARALGKACPSVAIVCLTGEASEAEVAALAKAGVATTLKKDEPLETIVAALRGAAGFPE